MESVESILGDFVAGFAWKICQHKQIVTFIREIALKVYPVSWDYTFWGGEIWVWLFFSAVLITSKWFYIKQSLCGRHWGNVFLFVWAQDCQWWLYGCSLSLSFFQLSEADRDDPSLMVTGPLTDQGSTKEGGPCSPTADPMKSQVQQGSPLSLKDPQMRSLMFM